MTWRSVGRVLVLITNVSIQPTAALQSPTSATGIYENWDADLWDFGASSEYPVLRVDFDRDGSQDVAHRAELKPVLRVDFDRDDSQAVAHRAELKPVLRVDFDRDGSTEDDIEKQRQT